MIDLKARTARIGEHDLREGDGPADRRRTGRDHRCRRSCAAADQRALPDRARVGRRDPDAARARKRRQSGGRRSSARVRAQGIGLCRTEHMFFGEERLLVVQEMIMASDEAAGAGRSSGCCRCSSPISDLRGHVGTAGHDPAARSAPCTSSCPRRTRRVTTGCASGSGSCRRRTRCSARAGAGSVSSFRRSTRCMSVRSSARLAPCRNARTRRRSSRSCTLLVGFAEELRRLRELTVSTASEEGDVRYRRDDDRAAPRLYPRGRDRRICGLLPFSAPTT